jgi:nitrogen fixation NifU-like protein
MYEFDSLDKELQEQIVEKVRKQYSAATVDHWLHPRNFGRLEDPDGHAVCSGTCGEIMEIFVRLKAGRISEAGFLTDGCITATASGSMAVELATSRSVAKARAISPDDILLGLGDLPRESRHCAALAAKTLRAAVDEAMALGKEPWKKAYRRRNPDE